ncbi:DUF4430 domain-containing protein [Vagococcus sp.]|uniref:DUF4430 domain-containing protein n=1 Tax=Vagococcus sp. TaxID=1933889 RepID=UPI003F96BBCF
MKKIAIKLSLATILFITVGCGQTNEKPKSTTKTASTVTSLEKKEDRATITLIEDEKEVTSKTIEFKEGTTIMAITKKAYDLTEDKGFVTEIDGIKQNENEKKYWMYYINGKEATKGANEIKVQKNDKIEWRLNSFE